MLLSRTDRELCVCVRRPLRPSLLFEHLSAHLVTASQLLQVRKRVSGWLARPSFCPAPGPLTVWQAGGARVKRTFSCSGQSVPHRPSRPPCPADSRNLILALKPCLNNSKNEKCKKTTLLGGIPPATLWQRQEQGQDSMEEP